MLTFRFQIYFLFVVYGVRSFHILRTPLEIQRQANRTARQIQTPKVYRCGDIGKDKVVNFVNANYPSEDKATGDCKFRLVITSPHVCQIRVDFVDTELMNPIRGECLSQFLLIQGEIWPTGLPPLCGINSDQHFYLHLEQWFANASVVDFNVVTVVRGRPYRFGLWLTQIDCSSFNALKAPEGCTQYYLSGNGTLKSFNYEGYRSMNSQNYQICIRPVKGTCGIQYEASEGDFGFKKSISSGREILQRSGVGTQVCASDYVMVPEGRDRPETVRRPRLLFNRRRKPASAPVAPPPPPRARPQIVPSVDRFCGTNFSPFGGESENKPVFSRVQSNLIFLKVKTTTIQEEQGAMESLNLTTGFRLKYTQLQSCSPPDVDMAVPHSIKAILDTLQWNNDGEISQRQPSGEMVVDGDDLTLADQNSTESVDDEKLWDYLELHTEDLEKDEKDLYDF